MAQLRVILDTGYLVLDNLPDFLTDALVIGLYLFLHPVVAVLVGKVDNLRQFHVAGGFPLHLFIVHHDFTVENLLFYPFIEVVRHRPHEHALREVGYFAGRYQAVHLGAYRGGLLPLVDCHALPFLQHLPETLRQDFCRFTDHLTAEHVAYRILYHTAFLVPIVTGKLAVILKAQQNRHLVASGGRNQVVKTTEVDSGQLVYNHRTFKLTFLVYQLHYSTIIQSQCRRIDVLAVAYSGGYPFSISGDIRSVPS